MAEDSSWKKVIFVAVSVLLFIIVLFLFVASIEQNYWLALPALFYFVFFIFREGTLRAEEINDRLKIKDRCEIRIDFWS